MTEEIDTFTSLFGLSIRTQAEAAHTDLIRARKEKKIKQKTIKGYTFQVASESDINFKKIMDDLSYADPLRIVKVEDKLYAVVHHTVYDKAIHSTAPANLNGFAKAIEAGVMEISYDGIKVIIKRIQFIKQGQWCRAHPADKDIKVEVIKVKV